MIAVPSMLDRNVDRLYQLGEPAGPTVLQLIAVVLQYNELVERLSNEVLTSGDSDWTRIHKCLRGHLQAMQILLGEAEAAVGGLHDARPPRGMTPPNEAGPTVVADAATATRDQGG